MSSDKIPIIESEERKFKFSANYEVKLILFYAILLTVFLIVISIIYAINLTTNFVENNSVIICGWGEFQCFEHPGDVEFIFIRPPANRAYSAGITLKKGVTMTRAGFGAVQAIAANHHHILVNASKSYISLNWTKSAAPIFIQLAATRKLINIRTSKEVRVKFGGNCVIDVTRNLADETKYLASFYRTTCEIKIKPGKNIPKIKATVSFFTLALESADIRAEIAFDESARPINAHRETYTQTFVRDGPNSANITILPASETTIFFRRNSTDMLVTPTAVSATVDNSMVISPSELIIVESLNKGTYGLVFGMELYMAVFNEDIGVMGFPHNLNHTYIDGDGYDMKVEFGEDFTKLVTYDKCQLRPVSCNTKPNLISQSSYYGKFKIYRNRLVDAESYGLGKLHADLLTGRVEMTNGTESPPSPCGDRFWRGPIGSVALVNDTIENMTLVPANLTRLDQNLQIFRVQTLNWTVNVAHGEQSLKSRYGQATAKIGPLIFAEVKDIDAYFKANREKYEIKGHGTSIQIENNVATINGKLAKITIDPLPNITKKSVRNNDVKKIFHHLKTRKFVQFKNYF